MNHTKFGGGKSIWRRFVKTFVFVLGILVLLAGPVSAHKFIVIAWVEGDTVYVESGFGDGSLAKNAKVLVYDDQKNMLLEGRTNDQGEFSFKVPKKIAMKVIVDAAMGHQGESLIPIEDIEAVATETTDTATFQKAVPEPDRDPQNQGQPVVVTGLTAKDIQVAVEKALDNKLRPVIKKLAKSEDHGPSVNDIFGGIGYILGLAGVGAYFNSRRKNS